MRQNISWENIKESAFIRNLLTLMSGTILAQVFSLAAYPVLTYLYVPSEFGLLGLYSAILVLVVVMVNGGYETAIMLPAEDRDAHHVFGVCIAITVLTSLLSLVLIFIGLIYLRHYFEDQNFVFWLYFLPVSVFLEGAFIAMSSLLNRQKKYKVLTRAKILQALSSSLVSILVGCLFKSFTGGLIIGLIGGQIASFMAVVFIVNTNLSFKNLRFYEMKVQATRFKDFPRYAIGASYLNAVSRQLPFFLLPYFYLDKNVLGYFTLANKILTAPLTFIGTTISQIYFQKAARANEQIESNLKEKTKQLSLIIAALSIIPMLVIVIWGKEIFAFVFGREYEMAGQYARWIMPWIALTYITNPLSILINVHRLLKFDLGYNFILLVVRILVLVGGGLWYSAAQSIAAFSMVGLFFNIGLLYWLIHLSGKTTQMP
jgi:lipopolysaccharide exporter